MNIKRLVYEAVLYIHSNFSEPISVDDVSAHVNFSTSYFAAVFRVLTGFTVKRYVNNFRLHCAATRLVESDQRIADIAFETGFSSQQTFTKSFSKVYGIAPAQFRQLKPQFEPFPPKGLWKEQATLNYMPV